MAKQITDREIHTAVKKAIELGIKSVSQLSGRTRDLKTKIDGRSLPSVYKLVRNQVVNGKGFFGYGSWHTYLKGFHGVTWPTHKRFWNPTQSGHHMSNADVHKLVNDAIQETHLVAGKHWKIPENLFNGRRLDALYVAVASRKVEGKGFFGTGSWDAYLEKFHGVVAVDQSRWGDERMHHAIVHLLKKYPLEKFRWEKKLPSGGYAPGVHGRSLATLYQTAKNHERGEPALPFFGHGNWKKYIKWVKENYGKA